MGSRPPLYLRAAYAALIGVGMFVFLFPLYWLLRGSLLDVGTFLKQPPVWVPRRGQLTLEGYRSIFEKFQLGRVFLNTMAVAAWTMVSNVLLDSMAGYALARVRFVGRGFVFTTLLATLLLPGEVVLIPMFLITVRLGLYDTFLGIVAPGMATVFGIFLMRQFFLSLPIEVEESAFVDGATRWRVFGSIALPMAKPALATVAILHFLAGWEQFIWPLVVTSSQGRLRLLQNVVASATQAVGYGAENVQWNEMFAASIIAVVPLLVLFLACQRYFVEGLSRGAVKG
jgi:multiple sugar transport system permease protein